MTRRVVPLALASTLAGPLYLAAFDAGAAEEKKGRIHADSEFFGFTHINPDGNGNDDVSNSVGLGIGRPMTSDASPYGIPPRPLFGLGGAYGLAKGRAWIGGKAAFLFDAMDVGDEDNASTYAGGQFVPYFRWIFLPGKGIRPYVEAHFGFGGGVNSFERDEAGERVSESVHVIYPIVGMGGGLHFFLVDAVSIDLGLNFDYIAPFGRRSGDAVPEEDEDWDKLADMINLNILLGLSVWLP
jgi:hypothetical protein